MTWRAWLVTGVAIVAALTVSSAKAQQPSAPACAPGSPSALQFEGLPSRIPFGREEAFSLDYADYEWNVDGPIDITMRSGSHVFFHDTTADELADLYLELDLRDPPATVTASFEQSSDDGDAPESCVRTIEAHTHGYRHVLAIDRCDEPSYRPHSITIACGDGNYGLSGLHWRGWNRRVAHARGKAYANDCIPYCAVGHFHRYPVRVRVSRLRTLSAAGYAYTRLRIAFPGPRPPGAPRIQRWKGVQRDGSFFWR